MRPRHAATLAGKITELRAVFVLGQRTLPFLEEVLAFVQEVAPLIESINASLHEHSSQLPQAASKLRSVTEATELATTEVLDLVDRALLGVGLLRQRAARTRERVEQSAHIEARLIRLLRPALADRPDLLKEVERLHTEKKALRRAEAADATEAILDDLRDHMGRIMISLQVQDITAQQIAGVHHLLESVRLRMARLAEELDGEGAEPPPYAPYVPAGVVAFDPDATYEQGRQQLADEVTAAFTAAPVAPPEAAASQLDIDAMFRSAAGPRAPEGDGAAPATQFDIDAMFAAEQR
jgi:hypothetical protein